MSESKKRPEIQLEGPRRILPSIFPRESDIALLCLCSVYLGMYSSYRYFPCLLVIDEGMGAGHGPHDL